MNLLMPSSVLSSVSQRVVGAIHKAFHDYGNLCVAPDRLMRERLRSAGAVTATYLRELKKLHELDEQSVAVHGSGYFLLALARRLVTDREYKPELPSQKLFPQSFQIAQRQG